MSKDPEVFYYSIGCPVCDDLFRNFFVFCVQNTIPYEVKRYVEGIEEPYIRYKDKWFKGDNSLEEFKQAWSEVKNVI